MHILIAPNSFKDSIHASKAAIAIQNGLIESRLNCTCECFPIGDGGDGTADLLIEKCEGQLVHTPVQDPIGRKINTSFGLIDNGQTAVIEMANASGIRLLHKEELSPLSSTSFGTGQQIKAALAAGVKKIIIGMGGSATVDGGVGILKALGARFLDSEGDELLVLPEDLNLLVSIDLSQLDERLESCEIIVLCDVANKLLGREGAAYVFGPQKGANDDAIDLLNKGLTNLAACGLKTTGKDMSLLKHGGTAGGAAAGLAVFLSAELVDGIDYFLQYTNFDAALKSSSLVITGEGSIDEQTLEGKGPFGVARRAKEKGLPVVALAGKVPLDPSKELQDHFDALYSINHLAMKLEEAILCTESNLKRTATALGNTLYVAKSINTIHSSLG